MARTARKLIKHGIDHARLLAFEKGGSDIDVFANDNTRRHIGTILKLIGASPQDRAQNCLDPSQRPAFAQRIVHERIECSLLAHDTFNDIAKKSGLSLGVFFALDLSPKRWTSNSARTSGSEVAASSI